MPDRSVHADNVLHLNLNTTDFEASHAFYRDLFGLRLKMQSGADDGDWRFHGIEAPVSSCGYFLYDDRGARVSPGLEIVEWYEPATAGSAYDRFAHRGACAVRLTVPTTDGLTDRAGPLGGTAVGTLGGGGLLLTDPDGVYVELVPASASAARIAGLRVGCADLDASLEWYATLGFAPTEAIAESELAVGDDVYRVRSVPVQLTNPSVSLVLTQWLDPIAEAPAETRLWFRGMVRMAISVEDLDDAMATLRAAGWDVPEPAYFALPGTAIDGLRVLFINDPDGFTVELVHRPAKHFVTSGSSS